MCPANNDELAITSNGHVAASLVRYEFVLSKVKQVSVFINIAVEHEIGTFNDLT